MLSIKHNYANILNLIKKVNLIFFKDILIGIFTNSYIYF